MSELILLYLLTVCLDSGLNFCSFLRFLVPFLYYKCHEQIVHNMRSKFIGRVNELVSKKHLLHSKRKSRQSQRQKQLEWGAGLWFCYGDVYEFIYGYKFISCHDLRFEGGRVFPTSAITKNCKPSHCKTIWQ